MENMITVTGVTKAFGRTPVLQGIDLEVARGTIFALLGPNGAGKTTLINILSTLVVPDQGTASVNGFDVISETRGVKSSISLTGQSAAVDEVLTADENLRMMGQLYGLTPAAAAARSAELLERFDLADSRRKRVKTLSGGMRRRLDLAISLLLTPPVIFLDEPTTGLDPRSRNELWAMVRGLAATGTTVLLTTQYLDEADELADRIAVLDHGRIIATGTPAELKSRVGAEVLSLHNAAGSLLRELPTDGSIAGLRSALALIDDTDADSVSLRRPTLDDVFLELTSTKG